MGLTDVGEKVVRRGRLSAPDCSEQGGNRNGCDRNFLTVEIARFTGLKLIDHVRVPTETGLQYEARRTSTVAHCHYDV